MINFNQPNVKNSYYHPNSSRPQSYHSAASKSILSTYLSLNQTAFNDHVNNISNPDIIGQIKLIENQQSFLKSLRKQKDSDLIKHFEEQSIIENEIDHQKKKEKIITRFKKAVKIINLSYNDTKQKAKNALIRMRHSKDLLQVQNMSCLVKQDIQKLEDQYLSFNSHQIMKKPEIEIKTERVNHQNQSTKHFNQIIDNFVVLNHEKNNRLMVKQYQFVYCKLPSFNQPSPLFFSFTQNNQNTLLKFYISAQLTSPNHFNADKIVENSNCFKFQSEDKANFKSNNIYISIYSNTEDDIKVLLKFGENIRKMKKQSIELKSKEPELSIHKVPTKELEYMIQEINEKISNNSIPNQLIINNIKKARLLTPQRRKEQNDQKKLDSSEKSKKVFQKSQALKIQYQIDLIKNEIEHHYQKEKNQQQKVEEHIQHQRDIQIITFSNLIHLALLYELFYHKREVVKNNERIQSMKNLGSKRFMQIYNSIITKSGHNIQQRVLFDSKLYFLPKQITNYHFQGYEKKMQKTIYSYHSKLLK